MQQQDHKTEASDQSSLVAQKKANPQQAYPTKEKKKKPIQAKNGNGKPITPIQARRGKPLQRKSAGSQGLPAQMRTNMESMGGVDLSDVKVHRNSSKPAEIDTKANSEVFQAKQAPVQQKTEAFAQGSDIHLAPGMDKHLAHEAWHVVQQKQGRVQPTTSSGGVAINDSPQLEKEADDMGAKAMQMKATPESPAQMKSTAPQSNPVQQKVTQFKRHSLEGKGEITNWNPMGTDDSFFEVNTNAEISPSYKSKFNRTLNHATDNKIDNKSMGDEGKIILTSQVTSLIDQNLGWYEEDKGSEFVSTFSYQRSANGIISVYADGGNTAVFEKKHAFEGGNKNNYNYIKTIQNNSHDDITYKLGFVKNIKGKTYSKNTNTYKHAHKDWDFKTGIDLGLDVKAKINLVMDGNDVLMLVGSRLMFKGKLSRLLKKFKSLGGEDIEKLLKKQKLELNVTPEIAAEFRTHFNYTYERDTFTKISESERTAYKTGGKLAEEINMFRIIQQRLTPLDNVFFDNEDQSSLTGDDKEGIQAFLNRRDTKMMLNKVKSGQYQIRLEGHASSSHSESYNQGIAQKRMAATRTFIMKEVGLSSSAFTYSNMGETQSEKGFINAGDRRVEITFVKI
ncbi:hypothetical protein BKI52_40910 [marine bacterium AO1-C]|nr:hypothetical protein BKI52_40910 [marine bacterium AO1-C]